MNLAARQLLKVVVVVLLGHSLPTAISTEENGRCPVQVSEHFLTMRPGRTHVTAESQCDTLRLEEEDYFHCQQEFNGNYTWQQENSHPNYVIFNLTPSISLIHLSLTYTVISSSQQPKVSFCPVPDSTTISDGFSNLELCREFNVEATGRLETGTLELPAENETSKVLMEVITQGIKADFKATRIMFHSNCTTAATTTAPVGQTDEASQSTTHSVVVAMETEDQQQGYNNTTSSARPGITEGHISTTVSLLLLMGLSLVKILQSA